MKSHASLAALALALAGPAYAQTGAAAPDQPQEAEPRGASQPVNSERRFDAIGYASVASGSGVTVSAPGLEGEFAEVTAVDTGKTIIAIVARDAPLAGRVAAISPAAAAALGVSGDAFGVRVRPGVAPGPEIAALRAGQANARADAPPALLAALRRKLGPVPVAATAPKPVVAAKPAAPKPATRRPVARSVPPPMMAAVPAQAPIPTPAPSPTPAPETLTPGFYVQYAALSSPERAAALAAKLGGVVERTDAVFRVHRGPFAADAEAKRERARAAALGYRDAQIVRIIP